MLAILKHAISWYPHKFEWYLFHHWPWRLSFDSASIMLYAKALILSFQVSMPQFICRGCCERSQIWITNSHRLQQSQPVWNPGRCQIAPGMILFLHLWESPNSQSPCTMFLFVHLTSILKRVSRGDMIASDLKYQAYSGSGLIEIPGCQSYLPLDMIEQILCVRIFAILITCFPSFFGHENSSLNSYFHISWKSRLSTLETLNVVLHNWSGKYDLESDLDVSCTGWHRLWAILGKRAFSPSYHHNCGEMYRKTCRWLEQNAHTGHFHRYSCHVFTQADLALFDFKTVKKNTLTLVQIKLQILWSVTSLHYFLGFSYLVIQSSFNLLDMNLASLYRLSLTFRKMLRYQVAEICLCLTWLAFIFISTDSFSKCWFKKRFHTSERPETWECIFEIFCVHSRLEVWV